MNAEEIITPPNTNSTPATTTPPIETPPVVVPPSPTETTTPPVIPPNPEPIATSTPPVAPVVTPPTPAPALESPIRFLLAKAKEKIQFRKQARLEKIMVFAKAQGGITNDQAQKLLRVSDATATRYLVQLTKSGRLRLVGKSKAARYIPVQ